MITGGRAFSLIFTFFFVIAVFQTAAQPMLPDIAGEAGANGVELTWNSQYAGIKAITVMRSRDSLSGYEIIGYVTRPVKGLQGYTDKHAPEGKNYYKLAIIFNSGLAWRSNYTGVVVTAHETKPAGGRSDENVTPVVKRPVPPPGVLESSFGKGTAQPIADTATVPDTRRRPVVSITADSGTTRRQDAERPKLHLALEPPNVGVPVFIRSRFVQTDSLSGNVRLFLPDDVSTHHYSIKFYDEQKHLVTEVPKINSSRIILDKRNFQRRGIYKFVIRRDVVELEAGYIIVDP